MTDEAAIELARLIVPGCRVAIGDGVGSPRATYRALSEAAEAAGDVELIVGWLPLADPALRYESFADARALIPAWGLRRAVDAGRVHALPVRLSTVPALLNGALRPDVLVTSVVRTEGGFAFGSEVSWQRDAVDAGAVVAAVVCEAHPHADAGEPLPADQVVVVGHSSDAPTAIMPTPPGPGHRELAEQVVRYVPDGCRLQVGPGPLSEAVLDALTRPVRIESVLLPDGVLGLDRRGLLADTPMASYLAGGPDLFAWADGRDVLHRLDHVLDLNRLSTGDPFVAVNMAVEIDEQGQVNVEGSPGSTIGAIGANPDFATAGARSIDGLSIIAVPSHHRGKPTLVEQLSMPVTTPGHDVDVVITERGAADLRGLDRAERSRAIRALWS